MSSDDDETVEDVAAMDGNSGAGQDLHQTGEIDVDDLITLYMQQAATHKLLKAEEEVDLAQRMEHSGFLSVTWTI